MTDKISSHLDNIEAIKIPNIRTKEQYSIFVLKELNKYIDTDFVLLIQYDGFIVNPVSWIPQFQNYDYIGAKWFWYKDGSNIGNGGFSLRSKRLLRSLSSDSFPISIESLQYGEDTYICRLFRRLLEKKYDIKFATESVADKFSHERSEPVGNPFGFHGLFNMWRYIKYEDLEQFIHLLHPRTLNAVETIELAMNYYSAGQAKQAEMICREILQHYPDHSQALAVLDSVLGKIDIQ